jgi:hypothetical protein
MLKRSTYPGSDIAWAVRVQLRRSARWLGRSRVHGGLVAGLLCVAFAWTAHATHVEPAQAEAGRLAGRAMQVERAAVITTAASQVTAAAPRVRVLPQPSLGLLAAIAIAQVANVAAAADAHQLEPVWQWLRRARRLPRSDCSEPDGRA